MSKGILLQSIQFSRRRLSTPFDLGIYRLISNLTFLSKLLERATYEQIVGYLDRFQLLPELQSAYRKYQSTETATIKVMSDVSEVADAGSVTLLGLLDLSAAFDTVDHRILFDRLAHDYGIRGIVISHWTQSIRAVQRSQLKHCTSNLRRAARVRPGADPLHFLIGRSRRHRSASGLPSASVRRRLINLRIDGPERCC